MDFNSLPPHWEPAHASVGEDLVSAHFPTVTDLKKKGILQMFLASVVHHHEWIKANLDPAHPIFSTPMFADNTPAELDAMKSKLTSGLEKSTSMTLTGVSAHGVSLVRVSSIVL